MGNSNSLIQSLTLIEDDTIEVKYKERVNIELTDMENILSDLNLFTKNKRLKRLIVITKNSSITKEARIYLQEQNHLERKNIIAEAVVVNSLAQKMAINFYLSFIKDDFPSKYFTDINKAKEWLKEL